MSQPPTEREVERLLKQLHSAEARRRKMAIDKLEERDLRDERVVQALEQIAIQDPFQRVRYAASAALAKFGRALPPEAEQVLADEAAPRALDVIPQKQWTRQEKARDFVIGFVGWFTINGMISMLLLGRPPFTAYVYTTHPDWTMMYCLSPILFFGNLAILVIFAWFRPWLALSFVAAFAMNLFLALLAGVLGNAVCGVPFFMR